MSNRIVSYDAARACVVLADSNNIRAGERFFLNGREWVAITNSVGYHIEIGGLRVPAGMVNDPGYPLPGNAVTAVLVTDVIWDE